MSATKIEKNTTYYLEILVTDKKGDPVTGLSLTYGIYKSLDNSLVTSGSLTDVGNGMYQASYSFDTVGQYRVLYTTPQTYSNEVETILVIEAVAKQLELLRALGLAQENHRIFSPVYAYIAGQYCMTSGTVKIYGSATDCDNDTNPIATYQVTATFDTKARMTSYKSKRTA